MITVIANLKGGTGKSTVTFNLAVWLSLEDMDITVVDLDPQRTLTDVAAVRLEEGIEPPVQVQFGALPNMGLLRRADEALIDVGTADMDSFKRALRIADRVLIPATPSQADIWSTQRFVQFLSAITDGNPPESIAVINRADTNRAIRASDEAAAALTALTGVRLISQRLSDRPVYRDSFSEGMAVFELEPRSRASAEFKALAEALFTDRSASGTPRPHREELPAALALQPIERRAKPEPVETDASEGTPEPSESREGGERKDRKKAMKEKHAGKGKKDKKHKKHKKDKKIKKGKKTKKGKKAKKGS